MTCTGCGLVRLAASAARTNREDYLGDDEENIFPADRDRVFGEWAEFRLSQLLEIHPKVARLAEVGSGTGHFLEAAARQGIDVKGFDLADHRTRAAGVEFGVSADPFGSLGSNAWDAVAAFHVLEHCPDPLAAVGAIVASLGPGGVGFVEVPGILEDVAPTPSMIDPRHQWYFSETTLRRLVEKAGASVIGVSRVGPTLGELEAAANAGRRLTRGWHTLKKVLPEAGVDLLRRIARPAKAGLIGTMAKLESGPKKAGLALNLCLFFRKMK
jgi:SAM-dependent methyltransferase